MLTRQRRAGGGGVGVGGGGVGVGGGAASASMLVVEASVAAASGALGVLRRREAREGWRGPRAARGPAMAMARARGPAQWRSQEFSLGYSN